MSFKIFLRREWCKRCGICIAFCPQEALGRDEAGYPYLKDEGRCTGCGWCELRCPDFAITISGGEDGEGEAPAGERSRG